MDHKYYVIRGRVLGGFNELVLHQSFEYRLKSYLYTM